MRASPIAAVAMLLAACGSPPPTRPPSPASPALSVRCELEPSSLRMEGGIGTFEVRIRNASKKYVVLRDLVRPGAPTVTWQVSLTGRLDYDARLDEYSFEPRRSAGSTEPAFNGALLCPGEELLLRQRVRLLGLPRSSRLSYFALERLDLSSQIYFGKRADRSLRYRRLGGEDLDAALAEKPAFDPLFERGLSSFRTVIFPHANSPLARPLQESVVLDARLTPRPFGLKDALARAGTTAEEVGASFTYCDALKGWMLRTPKGLVTVDPDGSRPLPEISDIEAFAFYVDTLGGDAAAAFEVLTPLEVRLEPRGFRMLAAGTYPYRYVLYAGAGEIPGLLKALLDEKLRIEVKASGVTNRFAIRR